MERPSLTRRVGEVETRVSAKHLCASSILARASMSAEHGHGAETSITSIVVSLIMALLGIGPILEKGEEVVQAIVAPRAAGHGH